MYWYHTHKTYEMDITHRINSKHNFKLYWNDQYIKISLTSHILRTLYNTLILPHLYYGLFPRRHDSTIPHKLQKRAIRTITCSNYNAHTETLHKTLNILKLPDMYDLQSYKLYYKIQREPVPNYFDSVIPALTHHYNTRQDTLQQHRTIHSFADHNCILAMIALITCVTCYLWLFGSI